MKKYIVFISTGGGFRYAQLLASKVNDEEFDTFVITRDQIKTFFKNHSELNPNNTLIHPRTAYPLRVPWMKDLEDLEKKGFLVINPTKVLRLTSDKLKSSLFLQNRISHPRSWDFSKDKITKKDFNSLPQGKYVAKPYTSVSQGKYVQVFEKDKDFDFSDFKKVLAQIPSDKMVVQEFIDYIALYRVIVINNKALPFSFVDRPTKDRWRVSVCLNKTSMEYVPGPDEKILDLAERTQEIIGGYINFIDIFETKNEGEKKYVLSEINTACILRIHENLANQNISGAIAQGLKEIAAKKLSGKS